MFGLTAKEEFGTRRPADFSPRFSPTGENPRKRHTSMWKRL